MTVLAVDTALGSCSAAVVAADGAVRAQRFEQRRKGHSEVLPAMAGDALAQASCRLDELAGLAAGIGPGTFTGLRVGLSYARGLGLSAGLPVAGVTTLAAVASDALAAAGPTVSAVLVALSTKRRDYYLQLFAPAGPAAFSTPAALAPHAVAAWLERHGQPADGLGLAGDAADSLAQEVPGLAPLPQIRTPGGGRPQAATIGQLALAQGLPAAGSAPPGPMYLRAPDVTPPA